MRYAEGMRAMTQRRIVLYATWGLCFGLMAVPELFSLSRAATIPITAAWLLLLNFGIVQIIRNELAKGERLKAMARGECSSCGYNMTGLESGVCPECGKSTGRPGTCPTCGHDLTGLKPGAVCPACGATRADGVR